jgi:hypothetical protein
MTVDLALQRLLEHLPLIHSLRESRIGLCVLVHVASLHRLHSRKDCTHSLLEVRSLLRRHQLPGHETQYFEAALDVLQVLWGPHRKKCVTQVLYLLTVHNILLLSQTLHQKFRAIHQRLRVQAAILHLLLIVTHLDKVHGDAAQISSDPLR